MPRSNPAIAGRSLYLFNPFMEDMRAQASGFHFTIQSRSFYGGNDNPTPVSEHFAKRLMNWCERKDLRGATLLPFRSLEDVRKFLEGNYEKALNQYTKEELISRIEDSDVDIPARFRGKLESLGRKELMSIVETGGFEEIDPNRYIRPTTTKRKRVSGEKKKEMERPRGVDLSNVENSDL